MQPQVAFFICGAQLAFTSWADEYTKFKNALAAMSTEQIIQAGYSDGTGQTVTFKRFEDLTAYENMLKSRADSEANTGGRRRTMFSFGNGGLG